MIWPPAEFRFEKMGILKLVSQPTNQLSISKLTQCGLEFFFFSPQESLTIKNSDKIDTVFEKVLLQVIDRKGWPSSETSVWARNSDRAVPGSGPVPSAKMECFVLSSVAATRHTWLDVASVAGI